MHLVLNRQAIVKSLLDFSNGGSLYNLCLSSFNNYNKFVWILEAVEFAFDKDLERILVKSTGIRNSFSDL